LLRSTTFAFLIIPTPAALAEGVAADAAGNIYGAEVGPKRLMKYVKN